MVLPSIVQVGDPVLRSRAAEVAPEEIGTPEMQSLFTTMIDVMRAAPGVGLAAPQIGVPRRIIVLEDREDLSKRQSAEERQERGRVAFDVRVLINPVLTAVNGERTGDGNGEKATFFEGCLSVAGYVGLVERHAEVEVTGLDEHGKPVTWRVAGWPARILQHEVDHLDGTIYVDRMLTRSFANSEMAGEHFAGKSVAEVRALLGV